VNVDIGVGEFIFYMKSLCIRASWVRG